MNRLFTLLALFVLLLLALCLPFEYPLVSLAVQWTNLELLLLFCLLLGGWAAWQNRPVPFNWQKWLKMPASWLLLWLLFAIALLLSTLFAPETELNLPGLRLNAFKATIRTLSGMGLALVIPQIIAQLRQLSWFIRGLIVSGLVTAVIGIAELLYGIPFQWLEPFRILPTTVGPFMRLSASFEHANQAAIYLEVIWFLLVANFWQSVTARQRWLLVVLGIASLVVGQAVLMTYSRSAMVTTFLVCLLLAGGRWLAQEKKEMSRWLGSAGILLLLILLNTWLDPIWNLRLRSEDDKSWYAAQFVVPEQLEGNAGTTISVPITLTNNGSLIWISAGENPIHIGASWQPRNSQTELPDRPRWQLPQPIRPGDQIQQIIPLALPPISGEYELRWDMVQENITWFSDKTGQTTTSHVTITSSLTSANPPATPAPESSLPSTETFVPITTRPAIPGRTLLWQAAAQQFFEHPLLGIGLDNFRLTYGRYLQMPTWNTTIHTNNWYIETLVSTGLLGTLPFLFWLLLLYKQLWTTLSHTPWNHWQIAAAAGLLVYAIHGFLDYFLMFNPTALLFWILVGIYQSKIKG